MPRLPTLVMAIVIAAAGTGLAHPGAALRPPRAQAATPLEEYTGLFVALARQALDDPRLAAPMPCLPHWLAGNDHVVVAVSGPGAGAGLARGDTLRRIGRVALTGKADGVWDAAMRAIEAGASTYSVAVARAGARAQLTLPCEPDRARQLHQAERAMWSAAARRDWRECIDRGNDMIEAFGARFSPPLMIMTRCASARAGSADPALTYALGDSLLQEMSAHPNPSGDQREQLFLTLRDLEMIRLAGGTDYATTLRAMMAERGVHAPPFNPDDATGR